MSIDLYMNNTVHIPFVLENHPRKAESMASLIEWLDKNKNGMITDDVLVNYSVCHAIA